MIKNLIYPFLIALLSCQSLSATTKPYGKYYKKGKDFEYTLLLNANKTFALEYNHQDLGSPCTGTWKFLDQESIELTCSEAENVIEALANGYMPRRQSTIITFTRNRIKIDNVVLKKQK